MFGFGGNRELKDLAHKIGEIFHHQISQAMESEYQLFTDVDDIAFTSGYLKAYFHRMFEHYENTDVRLEAKLFKRTCDGVIPKRLWDIYQRGEALGQLAETSDNPDIKQTGEAYEQGIVAGMEDADETHHDGKLPSKLKLYLTGNL